MACFRKSDSRCGIRTLGPACRGALRGELEEQSEAVGVHLDVPVQCTSYQQALSALRSETCGTVLPELIGQELDADSFTCISLQGLAQSERKICLAWNGRTLELRPSADQVRSALSGILQAV